MYIIMCKLQERLKARSKIPSPEGGRAIRQPHPVILRQVYRDVVTPKIIERVKVFAKEDTNSTKRKVCCHNRGICFSRGCNFMHKIMIDGQEYEIPWDIRKEFNKNYSKKLQTLRTYAPGEKIPIFILNTLQNQNSFQTALLILLIYLF